MAAEKANKAEEKNTSDRQKALDTALAQIERQFGKGSVMKMSDRQNTIIEVLAFDLDTNKRVQFNETREV